MAVNSIYTSSNRITGMYSDLDTDTLVKNLLKTKQSKIDKQYQTKTKTEWKNEAINEIMSEIKSFRNNYFSTLGENSLLKSSVYYSYNVTTTDTSGAVSVKASGENVSASNVKVAVYQLAKQSSISSSSSVSADGTEISSSNNTKLKNLSLANAFQFDDSGNISFEINGKKFTFNQDDTLQNMISTINADSDANVTMKYSRLTDTFTISSDVDGAEGAVTTKNITGNMFGANSAIGIGTGSWQNGQNSIAYIDGNRVERSSNEYSADGITYTLNKVTTTSTDPAAAMDTDAIDFVISRDFTTTIDAIKTFVNAYNELYSKIDSLINSTEKDVSRTYTPLTDAQKEEMTESEIEKWEALAKQDLLRRDSSLSSLLTQMRSDIYSSLGATGKSLASIGITTGSYFISDEKNKLVIDEDALLSALQNNPDEVVKMFTNNDTDNPANSGIAYKLYNAMNSYISIATDTVKSNEEKISGTNGIDSKISELEDKLATQAEKLYAKFAAMETALSKLNSQSSYISQLFSS